MKNFALHQHPLHPPFPPKDGYTSSLSHQTFSRLLSIVKILLAWKFFSYFFFFCCFWFIDHCSTPGHLLYFHRKLCIRQYFWLRNPDLQLPLTRKNQWNPRRQSTAPPSAPTHNTPKLTSGLPVCLNSEWV